MTAAIYELIGRLVVRTLWWRFRSELKIAGGVLAALVVVAGFLAAKRQPPEG
jgi:hypothetical protein